jgi:hypothetical protein
VSGYTSVTDGERREMLAEIGVESIDDLFDVPAGVRLDRDLELPDGLDEAAVYERLRELASRNADAESEVCFLGAGMYDHYAPAIVDAIVSRSEFLTPYTPYQPEIAQGGLQAMFEFQTAMSELTGLPLSSAGLYEGPSTVASAGYLAIGATKRRRFVVSAGVNPHSRETLATYSAGYPATIAEVGLAGGRTDLDALAAAVDEETAAVFVQYPNHLGAIEDLEPIAEIARLRPDRARHPPHARRRRRRHRGRRGAAARQPPRLRRSVVRLLLRDRGADPADAGPDRRRDDRRRRPPRLRPRAADARAAHPPREGDSQHLHGPGPERPRRHDLPELARPAGARRARRAARPPDRLRP